MCGNDDICFDESNADKLQLFLKEVKVQKFMHNFVVQTNKKAFTLDFLYWARCPRSCLALQGKSTLANRLLGRERSLTGPEPGLTRDAVHDRLQFQGRTIHLMDTAGWLNRARLEGEALGYGGSLFSSLQFSGSSRMAQNKGEGKIFTARKVAQGRAGDGGAGADAPRLEWRTGGSILSLFSGSKGLGCQKLGLGLGLGGVCQVHRDYNFLCNYIRSCTSLSVAPHVI